MLKICGARVEDFEIKYGLRPILAGPFSGTFGEQLLPNERVTVFTAAESASRHIRFSQRIVKNGQVNNDFHCIAYLIDRNNVIRRVPDELKNKITQAKFE